MGLHYGILLLLLLHSGCKVDLLDQPALQAQEAAVVDRPVGSSVFLLLAAVHFGIPRICWHAWKVS